MIKSLILPGRLKAVLALGLAIGAAFQLLQAQSDSLKRAHYEEAFTGNLFFGLSIPDPKILKGWKDLYIFNREDYLLAFSEKDSNALPEIDFEKYLLVGTYTCGQCLVICPDPRDPCHRNACNYTLSWKLSSKVSPIELPYNRLQQEEAKLCLKNDSLMVIGEDTYPSLLARCNLDQDYLIDTKGSVILAKKITSDCMAQFGHRIFYDDKTGVLKWEIYIIEKGCRGIFSRDLFVMIPAISGIRKYECKEVLVSYEEKD